ncbi:MAG TPA: BON domain-containing protein [Anaerolineales bacterium]|nr:BON domain-containing protein [Anaerolineales bacterium]
MQNRDWNRERGRRETENENDWDWYYYEYYYLPYGSERRNYGDRDVNRGSDRDRESSQSNYGNRGMYGREGEYDYGTYPYGRYGNRGRYSGVGPRGYRRSDERIADDINDRLTWHGQLDATDIEVSVREGVVTLTGSVDDRRQKRMAEDVAESVSGVEDVNNQLKIMNRSWNRGESEMGGMNRQIRPGMEVVGRDGENVGEVKEVRSNDFLVDRSMARDVYIPINACQTTGGQVRLNVRADEVDNQGWEMPELFETETSEQPKRRR